ncbi:hypothetical protein, partial [Escherichia coli]
MDLRVKTGAEAIRAL